MCGLVCALALAGTLDGVSQAALSLATAQMAPRGPDSAGEWSDAAGQVAMGHRRLAIIDLSASGHQPMTGVGGRYVIVFNGEIYNHKDLRAELERAGYTFASHSDTEVLMSAYAHWGAACLPRLRGMFTFVIWDQQDKVLFAARDAFGIKPLYFRQTAGPTGDQLWVASQVKALAAVGGELTRDPTAHAGFLLWGHVPEPFTPFKQIKALPAGHYVEVRIGHVGRVVPKCWFNLSETMAQAIAQRASTTDLRDAMQGTVAAHQIADVPVGVFLSAGLDSTTLAALMCQAPQGAGPVRSVTLGFEEYAGTPYDEVPLAELTARQLGTLHATVRVSRADFQQQLGALFAAMDQPSIDGTNTYFVSLATKQAGLKVALSGLGGDELFGGYPSFSQVPRLAGMPRWLQSAGPTVRRALAPWLGHGKWPKQAGLLEYSATFERAYLLRRALFMPWELAQHMPAEQVAEALQELATLPALRATHAPVVPAQAKVSMLEASWYMRNQLLRDADWASMAHSLELRVALVDVPLWQTVMPQRVGPGPITKRDMARTPARPLPEQVLNRPKSGFAVPVAQWLAQADAMDRDERNMPGLRPWGLRVYERWLESLPA